MRIYAHILTNKNDFRGLGGRGGSSFDDNYPMFIKSVKFATNFLN